MQVDVHTFYVDSLQSRQNHEHLPDIHDPAKQYANQQNFTKQTTKVDLYDPQIHPHPHTPPRYQEKNHFWHFAV